MSVSANSENVRKSLTARVASGGALALGGHGVQQVLRLASNLVIARLVAPEAFGLMAVAASIYIWAVMLTDIGIASNVIRSPNSAKPDFLRTIWTFSVLRGLAIWVITIIAALIVMAFASGDRISEDSIFSNPALPWVTILAGLQIVIGGFSSPNKKMAERGLVLRRVIIAEIAVQLATMAVTIGLAARGLGVWAFVIGSNVSAILMVVITHVAFPGPRMRFLIDREHFREIFNFGKWLVIASFFGFLVNRGDQVIFGWLMTDDRFNLYAVAAIWMMAAMAVFDMLINRVFYPAFSEVMRERPQNLEAAYKRARLFLDGLAVATAFGAFLLAEFIFDFIYPGEYQGVGHFIRLMSPAFLLLPYRLLATCVMASGDSRGFTLVTGLSGSLVVIGVPLVFHQFGETVSIIAFGSVGIFAVPVLWRLAGKHMKIVPAVEARMAIALLVLIGLLLR